MAKPTFLNLSGETVIAMLMAARNPSLFHSMFRNAVIAIDDARYLGLLEGEEPVALSPGEQLDREAYEELAEFYHIIEKLDEQIEEGITKFAEGDVDLTGN